MDFYRLFFLFALIFGNSFSDKRLAPSQRHKRTIELSTESILSKQRAKIIPNYGKSAVLKQKPNNRQISLRMAAKSSEAKNKHINTKNSPSRRKLDAADVFSDYQGILTEAVPGIPIGAGAVYLGDKLFGVSHQDLDPLTYSHQAIEVAHEGYQNINELLSKVNSSLVNLKDLTVESTTKSIADEINDIDDQLRKIKDRSQIPEKGNEGLNKVI